MTELDKIAKDHVHQNIETVAQDLKLSIYVKDTEILSHSQRQSNLGPLVEVS